MNYLCFNSIVFSNDMCEIHEKEYLFIGGGPPPTPEKVDPAIEKVLILLRPVVQGFDNGLDSDTIGKCVYLFFSLFY